MSMEQFLASWPKSYIRDMDLMAYFDGHHGKRHDAVKYAILKKWVAPIRRGLYLITLPYKLSQLEPFELAQVCYGPSYISLESALSYHGWIPEAVYNTTSVSIRRGKTFKTPAGIFMYSRIPSQNFYQWVNREVSEQGIFLMAMPWKALADLIYCHKKKWNSLLDLTNDMRIEESELLSSNIIELKSLCTSYKSPRVQKVLSQLYKEISP